jgi:hypothetical protein
MKGAAFRAELNAKRGPAVTVKVSNVLPDRESR